MTTTILGLTASDPSPTNAGIVHYTATFSAPVTGVDASQFTLTTTGVSGAAISSVAPIAGSGGQQYTVTINTGAGNGTLKLILNGAGIRGLDGNGLPGGTFQAQTTYATGADPRSVAVGDVNGDGKPDLVTANYHANTVSVLLGDGSGGFQPQTSYATDPGPFSIAIGDVNGDGKPDLVAAIFAPAPGTNTVSVLLGNGNGTFQAQTSYASGGFGPQTVAIGDLNGDGKQDLVTANFSSNLPMSILLGNGNGTFQGQTNFSSGAGNIDDVVIGDVNGDGKLDLVTAGSTSGAFVQLGNGNGTFQTAIIYPTQTDRVTNSSSPSSVAIGDLNGDGRPDLVTSNLTTDTVSVFLGKGDGTSHPQTTYAAGNVAQSVAIGDLNGDGKPDLVTSNLHAVSELLGNGDGTFQARSSYATATGVNAGPNSVAIADFNGDGRLDVVVANSIGSDTVSVLLNIPPTLVGSTYTIDKNASPMITSNGGGDTAAISISENTTAVTTVAATDPDAGKTLTYSIVGGSDAAKFQINSSTGALSFIAPPDFETPSDVDHNNSYIVQVRASDGSLFDNQTITVNVTDVIEIAPINGGFHGDFGGDHKADLLLRAPNGALTLLQMSGGQIASSSNLGSTGNEWHIDGVADFDGGGTSDVLWRGDNGSVATWLMNGAQIISNTNLGAIGNEWHIDGTADFGGDGKADILWRGDNGTLALWQMNGNQIAANTNLGTTGNDWHVVALADFGGDHKSDVLWRSDNGAVALWQMNGSQIASNTSLGTVAQQLHVVGAGDFNGDGKADILWRADDGAMSLWQMDGATIQSNQAIGAVGNEWHVDGTGDFNGDGKTDILWRANDGTAALWTMDGAHIASQQTVSPLAGNAALSVHHYDFV